ncbi:MAG: tRNA pseudouridine(55) synthase TruB [Alphaproteobacteria bacterium]|nr:tRNA pseudouridine(55) synthase TruB [Alphaproteobacteria bacterium]
MDGWIILDKPTGLFSKSAAMRTARLFETKKNGHVGTLDPMASGVLPVAIGNATKMVPFLEEVCDRTKEYLFSVQFGFETDTLDITGAEINRTNLVPDQATLVAVLPEFVGKISQVPPLYSAVHVSGQRAYELARAGQIVDMPVRQVEVYLLELVKITGVSWHFRMRCSPGTYVRSIARDIAKRCGTVATVDMIRRTQTSGFTLKNAVELDFLEKVFNNGGDVGEFLAPVDLGLGDIPVLNLTDKETVLYKNGGFINKGGTDGLVRVYFDDVFVGIGVLDGGVLKPKRTI